MPSTYYRHCALSKPESRKTIKARERRRESKILHMVRMHDVARDGFCRIARDRDGVFDYNDPQWTCDGPSELMHLENQRRFKTRGQQPALRHTTAGTCMGCAKHHALYDARRLRVDVLSANGADGDLRWRLPD